jgi:hypothetical protein
MATFCKHLVALAVAWLGESADRSSTKRPDPRQSRDRPRPITMADVRAYLDGQDHGTLVEMILSEADRDDRLRERLLIRTTMAAAAGAGAGQIRRAIDRAVRVGSFVDYAGAYDFARGIHDAIDLVEDLLRPGQPAVVIELSEHALRRVEQVLESVDDSDGEMGGLLERLQELHLVACRAARPDPDELATRLFAWELGDEWDVFSGARRGRRVGGVYKIRSGDGAVAQPLSRTGESDLQRQSDRDIKVGSGGATPLAPTSLTHFHPELAGHCGCPAAGLGY